MEDNDGTVRKANTMREVEGTLFQEIHGKRFYLAKQAPICKGRLRGDFGYMANMPSSKAVLKGRYTFPTGGDEGTKELLNEVARIRRLIPANTVVYRFVSLSGVISEKKPRRKHLPPTLVFTFRTILQVPPHR